MGLSGARWCDFVVWTPKECIIERIPYDEKFWKLTKQNILNKSISVTSYLIWSIHEYASAWMSLNMTSPDHLFINL